MPVLGLLERVTNNARGRRHAGAPTARTESNPGRRHLVPAAPRALRPARAPPGWPADRVGRFAAGHDRRRAPGGATGLPARRATQVSHPRSWLVPGVACRRHATAHLFPVHWRTRFPLSEPPPPQFAAEAPAPAP